MSLKITLIKTVDRTIGFLSFKTLCYIKKLFNLQSSTKYVHPIINVNRILIIRPGGIGDLILILPLINLLKKKFPKANITLIAETRNYSILKSSSLVDEIILYDKEYFKLIKLMWFRGKYDIIFDTEQFHYLSAVYVFFIRSKAKVGINNFNRGILYTHSSSYKMEDYEIDCFLRLYESYFREKADFDYDKPFFTIPEVVQNWVKDQIIYDGSINFVGICVGASIERKRWQLENFSIIANKLIEKGYHIIFIGNMDDHLKTENILKDLNTEFVHDFTGKVALIQSAGLLEKCRFFIGIDSGLMHVAYSLGVKTIGLFGPGSEIKWAPRGKNCIPINNNLQCSPCTILGRLDKCYFDYECMRSITVEMVEEAIQKLMRI